MDTKDAMSGQHCYPCVQLQSYIILIYHYYHYYQDRTVLALNHNSSAVMDYDIHNLQVFHLIGTHEFLLQIHQLMVIMLYWVINEPELKIINFRADVVNLCVFESCI